MDRTATLPFTLRRSRDVYTASEYTSTTETIHGLLHLEGGYLTIQWRLARKVDRMGMASVRTDEEVESVREVVIPLAGIAGAAVPEGWLARLRSPRMVLTASNLAAFEPFTGPEGLRLDHPARLILPLRRRDRLASMEFVAELELALAERLGFADARPSLPERGEPGQGDPEPLPSIPPGG